MKITSTQKAFTLIEILLVVAAIAILAGIVILAINPGKQLGDTRNSQRRADVNTILNAVYQYNIDTGAFPNTITSNEAEVCKTGTSCSYLVSLSALTENEKYLVSIPYDPTRVSGDGTGYAVSMTNNGRIVVKALLAEQGATIQVTR